MIERLKFVYLCLADSASSVVRKGAFTLAQFRGRFCTKLARFVMKFFLAKRASLMQNRAQNSQV
jgi:hypothetical protein